MKYRIISAILAALSLAALVSCGAKEEPVEETKPKQTTIEDIQNSEFKDYDYAALRVSEEFHDVFSDKYNGKPGIYVKDLDLDGVPELLVQYSDDIEGTCPTIGYYYKDGEFTRITDAYGEPIEFDTYSFIPYMSKGDKVPVWVSFAYVVGENYTVNYNRAIYMNGVLGVMNKVKEIHTNYGADDDSITYYVDGVQSSPTDAYFAKGSIAMNGTMVNTSSPYLSADDYQIAKLSDDTFVIAMDKLFSELKFTIPEFDEETTVQEGEGTFADETTAEQTETTEEISTETEEK